jgi:acyl carrier protein
MIIDELNEIISELKGDLVELSMDSNLIDDFVLDSLQMINFILQIEDRFNIEIDFDKLDFKMFQKCSDLIFFIEETKANG